MSTPDAKTFQNPKEGLEYQGSFSVELTDNAPRDVMPSQALMSENTVKVTEGRINQIMGGFQFRCDEQPFHLGYQFIKVIREGKGDLLWVNPSC